jgi:hypothetical protein
MPPGVLCYFAESLSVFRFGFGKLKSEQHQFAMQKTMTSLCDDHLPSNLVIAIWGIGLSSSLASFIAARLGIIIICCFVLGT